MPKIKPTTFSARAKSWAAKRKLHGPQVFLRYVIFCYLDCLSKESNDFIFKGGNLLWLYIHTPRQTIDLDLVTRNLNKTPEVKRLLEKACKNGDGIHFELKSINEVLTNEAKGAAATIEFSTEGGASNSFDLDIVYVIPTHSSTIPSPVQYDQTLNVATIENIIVDKLSACHRFAGGNTRMKDFDDLWRLAQSKQKVKWKEVKKLVAEHAITLKRRLDKRRNYHGMEATCSSI